MSTNIDIRCALTQKVLNTFCDTFHILDEVHPVLPNPNDTMHERPAGKVGLYTRFFDFFNFRDHVPASTDFDTQDYVTLVTHPSPFRKFSEPFLCLVWLSRHYSLDEDTYPLFVDRNGEGGYRSFCLHSRLGPYQGQSLQERAEGEPRVLEVTVGRTVLLLPVAPDHFDSELEASVNRLFDEGGFGVGGEQEIGTGVATGVRITFEKDAAIENPMRLSKRRQTATDVGGSSRPPKKLRSDYGTSGAAASAGKSPSALKELLALSVLNVQSGVEIAATFPFVTSSVSATPERERFVISSDSSHHSANASEAEDSSIIRSAIVPPVVIEEVTTTSVASVPTTADLEPSSKVLHVLSRRSFQWGLKKLILKICMKCLFRARTFPMTLLDNLDASREFIDHLTPSVLFAQIRDMDYKELFTEFSVGTVRQACLSAKVRMRTEFSLNERKRLESELEKQTDLLKSKDAKVEYLRLQLLLKAGESAEAIHLRVEASNFEFVKKSLRDEVSALRERDAILEKERDALDGKAADLAASVTGKERELTALNAQMSVIKSQNNNLVDQVHELEVASFGLREKLSNYDNLTEQLEEFQDAQLKVVNDKFERLYADFGMKLTVTKCLHSSEYFSALGAAIGKAIEKGMQYGLAVGITHGAVGRTLADTAAHNPSAEADYVSALQHLQSINFSLLGELRSNKDASIDTLISILHLEDTVAKSVDTTSNVVPTIATTSLSTTFASISIVSPITVDDYSVVGVDDQVGTDGDENPFPNVEDAEVIMP
uniref:Transposase (Putative), gypsy type n=1 Tax=Tanacetum cinerariifolium TaxID=118510 RepID=A0A699IGT6_TANCI|nr:hypothetical protein [Tanacetum cinerariifolium]